MPPIQALLFDVFGTVVNWRASVVAELEALGKKYGAETGLALSLYVRVQLQTQTFSDATDWGKFAQDWWSACMKKIGQIAAGASGPLSSDVLHREILDAQLSSPEWSHIGRLWDEATRQSINLVWHRLNGWPDTVEGLDELKKHTIIAALSNGNIRQLVDMAKHAGLPWDMIFSTEFFDSFKPNPKIYVEAVRHLSLPPESCAMVAAHIYDLRAAAKLGMRTIYVRRLDEDLDANKQPVDVKSKADGGDVDYVVDSFTELAEIIASINAGND
ncbi:hypothetical protein CVT25_007523 [Psilocybe cyanescens]|uniref:Haloacid dehalogenase, type II n=1 Tax=Psilocybe cyanescens TaxID=93625 RepID=A0A409XGB4_PSICY|nr:hypothetical protein CVT25_007523 [Psilocybe cyanescens]